MNVKSYFLSIWNIIDPIYYSCTRLTYIEAGPRRNIFRVRLVTYRGKTLKLSDGTFIRNGDALLKIHLHNVFLLKEISSMASEVKKGKAIYRLVQNSLPGLAFHLKNHPKSEKIKGIIGITTLNRACHPLGFESYSIDNAAYRAFKWLTLLPIYFLSVSRPIRSFKKQSPKFLLMSKEALLARYGCS